MSSFSQKPKRKLALVFPESTQIHLGIFCEKTFSRKGAKEALERGSALLPLYLCAKHRLGKDVVATFNSSIVNCRAQSFKHINLKRLYSLTLVPADLVNEDSGVRFARDN